MKSKNEYNMKVKIVALVVLVLTAIFLAINGDNADAGLVSKPYTFTSGTTIRSAQVNSDFDTLYNLVNGTLDNANIAAAAGIVDTKLATISTANKISETAFVCAADWDQVTDCDAVADNADSLHIHDAAYITFSDSDFTGTDVLSAITEVSTFVGYASGSTGTLAPSYFIWIDETTYAAAANATATFDLSALQTTGVSGLIFDVSVDISATGPIGGGVGIGQVDMYMQQGGATDTISSPFIYYNADECTYRSPGFRKADYNFSDYSFTAGSTATLVVNFNTGGGGSAAVYSIQVTTSGYK